MRLLSRNDAVPERALPARSPPRSDADPATRVRGRRRGRRVRRRADELRRACSSAASGPVRSSSTSSTCSTLDGHDVTALPLRARKALLRDALTFDGPDPPHAAPQPRRRGALPRGVPQGLGGADRQARRRALRPRPLARLAEVQVRRRAGARDRRLHGAARAAAPTSARCSSATTRASGCATPARSAPASRSATLQRPGRRGWRRCAATTRRSPTRVRERDATWVEPELVAQVGFTRVDARRAPAPPSVPRAARRQGRRRRWCASDRATACRPGRPERRRSAAADRVLIPGDGAARAT